MSERSIVITVWNHSGVTLTKFIGQASAGGAPTAAGLSPSDGQHNQTVNIPNGGSLAISASNSDGGCSGLFALQDSANTVKFQVAYTHPGDNHPTTVKAQPDKDFPSCTSVNDKGDGELTGHDVTVGTGLYVGRAQQEWDSSGNAYTAGYVVPLASNPYSANNARDVVNSVFQSAVRTPDAVQHWYDQSATVPYRPADYSGGQLGGGSSQLVDAMLNLWPTLGSSTSGPDHPLIGFLADFLVPTDTTKAPLVMYVPKISYSGYDGSGDTQGPIYLLSGYQAYPLAGSNGARFDSDAVKSFLLLLLAGGHFVNIQAARDFQNFADDPNAADPGRDLYQMFKDTFSDNATTTGRHSCTGNSHYTNTINTSGWYYGGQMGEWASSGCGLLLSLLVAQTADSQYNTFMQLEGWPADNDVSTAGSSFYDGGPRHGADYDAYNASLWNISTFGACPYSEKRATTIFLAPAPWVPTIYKNTGMMPYVGAETPQDWLKTSLVKVPSGTPSTPSQYG